MLTSSDPSEAVINSTVPGQAIPGQLTSFNDDRGSRTNVGTALASAMSGFTNPDGVIRLGVTGFPDINFVGAHFQNGNYELFVRVGSGAFPSSP